jgi:lysophospholipase L1-like esterase
MSKITLLLLVASYSLLAAPKTHWIGTWGASPSPQMTDSGLSFENQTIREIVRVSAGGNSLRLRLSNAYGKETVLIGAVRVALREKDSTVVGGSDRPVTFSGRSQVAIPPDALVLSDPIKLDIPDKGDLAISIFLPKAVNGAGIHYSAQQTAYIGAGDLTASQSIQEPRTTTSWVFLTGVDVEAPESASVIVAFGDSITDGARSTVDANLRWPNVLAERLLAQGGKAKEGVLDEGIGGNRILHDASSNMAFGVSALARFDRDVLAQPGVKYVIVLEGINDIGHAGTSAPESETVSAEDIIAGLKQLIERAHEKGLKIFGATLTPFEGAASRGYFTPEKEVKRKAVNEWIRTGGAFDGVIDFERAIRDPEHPDRMLPAYDGGDHLHPGDAGYKAMGEAIDLKLFR